MQSAMDLSKPQKNVDFGIALSMRQMWFKLQLDAVKLSVDHDSICNLILNPFLQNLHGVLG